MTEATQAYITFGHVRKCKFILFQKRAAMPHKQSNSLNSAYNDSSEQQHTDDLIQENADYSEYW